MEDSPVHSDKCQMEQHIPGQITHNMGRSDFELLRPQTISEIIFEVVIKNWSQPIGPLYNKDYAPIDPIISPLVFGVIVALISGIILSVRFNSVTDENDLFKEISSFINYVNVKSVLYREFIFIVVCGIGFIVLLPILFGIVCCLLTYKSIVQWVIKKKHSQYFKEFLNGSDAVWALEDDVSRSIINIMGIFKIPINPNRDPSLDILEALRNRIESKLSKNVGQFSKMFYTRRSDMGFYFWTNEHEFHIEEYIRLMPDNGFGEELNEPGDYFGNQCNQPLHKNHSTSWEILVGRKSWKSDTQFFYCPVLFRIHHSLGDGVALLRVFLEALTDKKQDAPAVILKQYSTHPKGRKSHSSRNECWQFLKALSKSFMNFYYEIESDAFWNKFMVFCTTPASMVRQVISQKIDENVLHKTRLSGKKIIAWHFERDNENLMQKIKQTKRKSSGNTTFTNILLAALSNSIENYLEYKHTTVPDNMTVVIPKRVENEGPKIKLQNKFSVAFQSMPISSKNQPQNIHLKLKGISDRSDTLYKSSNYLVNYWMMAYMAWLLPINLMRPLCESVHCTMVLSNLPGPQEAISINGYEMTNILFWLPNRGNSGLGLSVLSYNNRLQIGLLADNSVIESSEDMAYIMQHFVYHLGSQ